jgi:hypothetical protein
MGLNLSTAQIAHALDRHAYDVYHRTMSQRTAPKKAARVSGAVECDGVSVGAGHTGCRANVRAQGRQSRRCRVEGSRGRGTSVQEKPPIGGMIEGGGDVAMRLLAKVTQEIIKPLIKTTRAPGRVLTRKSRSFLTLLKDCLKWKVRAHSRNSSTHDRLGFAATN